MNRTDVQSYYASLASSFAAQAEILTRVLPHRGERGVNNELILRAFLQRTLPRRFSVGSGFVVCSDPNVSPSSQSDIVIFDEFFNSPLHRELASFVYPVESVYGTVEVKSVLTRRDIGKLAKDINKVRAMAAHGRQIHHRSVPVDGKDESKRVVLSVEGSTSGPPPRSYVFAYSQSGWQNVDDLVASLKYSYRRVPTHIHGLVILDKGWFVTQVAHASKPPMYKVAEGRALLDFLSSLLISLGSLEKGVCSMDAYFGKTALRDPLLHTPRRADQNARSQKRKQAFHSPKRRLRQK